LGCRCGIIYAGKLSCNKYGQVSYYEKDSSPGRVFVGITKCSASGWVLLSRFFRENRGSDCRRVISCLTDAFYDVDMTDDDKRALLSEIKIRHMAVNGCLLDLYLGNEIEPDSISSRLYTDVIWNLSRVLTMCDETTDLIFSDKRLRYVVRNQDDLKRVEKW